MLQTSYFTPKHICQKEKKKNLKNQDIFLRNHHYTLMTIISLVSTHVPYSNFLFYSQNVLYSCFFLNPFKIHTLHMPIQNILLLTLSTYDFSRFFRILNPLRSPIWLSQIISHIPDVSVSSWLDSDQRLFLARAPHRACCALPITSHQEAHHVGQSQDLTNSPIQ